MLKMLSLREAERETGLTYATLRNLVRNGEIPSVRVGRKIFLNSEVLRTYLQGNRQIDTKH